MRIKIVNNSSFDSKTLSEYINAIQIQLDRDLYKWYGYKIELSSNDGDYNLILEDRTDTKGAFGYHTLYNNIPIAKIFIKDLNDRMKKISVALSHEIMEMVCNPYVNKIVVYDNMGYLYECCDPTQCDELGYKINDIIVSNFVTPHWFNPSSKDTVFDFCNRIKTPFQILRLCCANVAYTPFKNWFKIGADSITYKI